MCPASSIHLACSDGQKIFVEGINKQVNEERKEGITILLNNLNCHSIQIDYYYKAAVDNLSWV